MIRSVLVRVGIKDVGSNPTVITTQDSPNGMASPLQGEIMPVRFRYPALRKHLHNVSRDVGQYRRYAVQGYI